ncbi:MAG: SDR family oxidoreductase [Oligoflexia bacterium]|nr:SDR family oxidoreductase [Oligoflexia bacterium]
MDKISRRKALVTGGTRGIGSAIAERLEADGVEVVRLGRASHGTSAVGFDLSKEQELSSACEYVREGRFDILINNAGITAVGAIEELSSDQMRLVQQVNAIAPFELCRAATPAMVERRWGRIVNISSVFGLVGRDNRTPYVMSKFSLNGLTAGLAAEVARFGVLVNSVCPGFIDTELTRSVLSPAEMEQLVARVPARRLGTPVEVAAFVAWLAGPQNSFISGQSIAIDGGFSSV